MPTRSPLLMREIGNFDEAAAPARKAAHPTLANDADARERLQRYLKKQPNRIPKK